MHRRALMALLISSSLAACLGFDELQGGVDAGNSDASEPDGNFSDATNDAGNTGDSSIDAGFDAGNSYCSKNPGHSFCDDFDESADILSGGWTLPYLTSPSTLSVTSDASASAPASLVATVPSLTAATSAARLAKAVTPIDTTHVHVEFDIKMCDLSTITTGEIEIFKLGFGDVATGTGVSFQAKAGGAYLTTNATGYPFSVNLTGGVWTHVAIDLHLGNGNTSTATISFNGLQVSPPDASINPVTIDFDAGFLSILGLYGNDSPTCTAFFDNVVMDFD